MSADATRADPQAVRRRFRTAHGGQSVGEVAYQGYVALLVGVVVLAPVVRAVILALMTPPAIATLTNAALAPSLAVAAAGLVVLVVSLGGMRGPVAVPPLLALLLAGGPVAGRRALRRPFAAAALAMVGLATAALALPATALGFAGALSALDAVLLAACGVPVGIVLAVAWLLGQRLDAASVDRALLAVVATGALGAVALGMGVPLAVPNLSPPLLALIGTGAAAAVALACVPRMLDGISPAQLQQQAGSAADRRDALAVGDLAAAGATLIAPPTTGRRRRAVHPGLGAELRAWRMVIATASRSPRRFVRALVLLPLAGAMLALAASGRLPLIALAVPAAAVLFASSGVFTGPLRLAIDAALAPALFGGDPHAPIWRFTRVGMLLPAALAMAGALLTVPFTGDWLALAVGAITAFAVGATRTAEFARGPMPPSMLNPMPTAFGDMSALMVLGWQLGPVLAPMLAGLTATAAVHAPFWWLAPLALIAFELGQARSSLDSQTAWSSVPPAGYADRDVSV